VTNELTVTRHDSERLLEDLNREYYAIVDVVSGFDQRLMVLKAWSVTVTLAGLGLAFQWGHYTFFALAAATGLAFWYLDSLIKRHQLRHYLRMRDIEVAAFQLNNVKLHDGTVLSAPRPDWSAEFPIGPIEWDWRSDLPLPRKPETTKRLMRLTPWLPNVALPHIVAVLLGLALFIAAVVGAPGLDTLSL
jgi:hypothetical protein